jgi:hypothetical protein
MTAGGDERKKYISPDGWK